MRNYVGTRRVNAVEQTRLEYNVLRGWELPNDENGNDEGFMVKDVDTGHTSWLPSLDFIRLYGKVTELTFGEAIEAMKNGSRVSRNGWNGKSMWLYIEYPSKNKVGATVPYIMMYTTTMDLVPWLASQSDVLSEDWMIVED